MLAFNYLISSLFLVFSPFFFNSFFFLFFVFSLKRQTEVGERQHRRKPDVPFFTKIQMESPPCGSWGILPWISPDTICVATFLSAPNWTPCTKRIRCQEEKMRSQQRNRTTPELHRKSWPQTRTRKRRHVGFCSQFRQAYEGWSACSRCACWSTYLERKRLTTSICCCCFRFFFFFFWSPLLRYAV